MIRSTRHRPALIAALLLVVGHLCPVSAARAELVLSQLVVELQPGEKARQDIEVLNTSAERAYVAVEPIEVVDAGRPGERRVNEPDPEKRGLLVAPARMILEPGQRKLVRLAALASSADRERVYRVTVKPVAGELAAETSGLKILIGYSVLVLVRPADPNPRLVASRSGETLNLRNEGNVSIELTDGRQCNSGGTGCVQLPGKRLYAGAEWSQKLNPGLPAEYVVVANGRSERRKF